MSPAELRRRLGVVLGEEDTAIRLTNRDTGETEMLRLIHPRLLADAIHFLANVEYDGSGRWCIACDVAWPCGNQHGRTVDTVPMTCEEFVEAVRAALAIEDSADLNWDERQHLIVQQITDALRQHDGEA